MHVIFNFKNVLKTLQRLFNITEDFLKCSDDFQGTILPRYHEILRRSSFYTWDCTYLGEITYLVGFFWNLSVMQVNCPVALLRLKFLIFRHVTNLWWVWVGTNRYNKALVPSLWGVKNNHESHTVCHSQPLYMQKVSLQNWHYFFMFFRQAKASMRWARSMRHMHISI